MSERTFFDSRNMLPGYTFILWNVLINLKYLTYFSLVLLPSVDPLKESATLFGVLLGFLALASGIPIGFLISQFWHSLFSQIILKWWISDCTKKLKTNSGSRREAFTAYNYIVHSWKDDGIRSYMHRRWDLMMSLGSSGVAICLSLVTGSFLRTFALPQFQRDFANAIAGGEWFDFTSAGWVLLDATVLVFTGFLVLAVYVGFRFVWRQHCEMSDYLLKLKGLEGKKPEEIEEILRKEYTNQEKSLKSGKNTIF